METFFDQCIQQRKWRHYGPLSQTDYEKVAGAQKQISIINAAIFVNCLTYRNPAVYNKCFKELYLIKILLMCLVKLSHCVVFNQPCIGNCKSARKYCHCFERKCWMLVPCSPDIASLSSSVSTKINNEIYTLNQYIM